MRQKSMSIIASTSKKEAGCGYVLTPERERVTAQTRCPFENHVAAMVACVNVWHENMHPQQLQQLSSLWLQTLMCIPFPPLRLKVSD